MKNDINIAFIMDDGYLIPTCVAITSLIENRNQDFFYHVYVVVPEGISGNSKRILERLGKNEKGVMVYIKEANMMDLQGFQNTDKEKFLAATEAALLKFKLPEIFPNLEKILYLDGDILVKDGLVELYETDMNDKCIAAVRDLPQVLYDVQILGKDIAGANYFNSGVMLLNLSRMREKNSKEQLIVEKRRQENDFLMDQNIFNIVFKDDVIQLPFLYNVCYINLIESASRYKIEKLNDLYQTNYENPYEIIRDIKIMHFSSKLKPWLFYDVPLADEWIYYYKKSVIANIPIQRVWHTRRNIELASVKEQIQELMFIEYDKREIVPIVFATNREYAPYVAVAIQSIYECSSEENFYDINILIDASMTNNLKEKFKRISYNNMSIRMWDVRNCFEGINLYSVGHYSRQMYFRWLIPEVFSQYDKVLYLDCDLVVMRDVAELFKIDICDNYIGAVNNFSRSHLESYVKNKLNLQISQYYNSGVLLINTKEFILNQIKNKCIFLLSETNKLMCPDQDVINIVCQKQIRKLDDKWNFQWHHQFSDACEGKFIEDYKERYDELLNSEPAIIHYTSFIKPWNCPERPFADVFWGYCRRTVFYEDIIYQGILRQAKNILLKKKDNEEEQIKAVYDLQYQLGEIRKSKSYKIGRFVTFIPRWIRHVIFHVEM